MKLKELADKEIELHSKVTLLEGTIEYKEHFVLNSGIPEQYKRIHAQYSQLAHSENEALKRGLFIQWYSLAEPLWLSGISELSKDSEQKIISILNDKILAGKVDNELKWMLEYYLDWDWVFKKYEGLPGIDKAIRERKNEMPDHINSEEMNQRGQMGIYWNSISIWE
ncbi:hypothetical protein [Chryseobacterium sp.]|uniref:hypothetical protein n=1 Tax=Chryseobacterium sp. TaxID=1871047 RepID=UPI0011CBA671|nr:hypothetical protein [Chryseobacterium sp.]TXF79588.1 hypothetical protein FUA25_04180 [Chryseobacterium sp.]